MSSQVLVHARHTAKEVSEAASRAWPDLLFMICRDQQGDLEEALLAPDENLRQASASTVIVDGTMTGSEMSAAFKRAFGVVVAVSAAASGRALMDTALDQAR